MKLTHKAKGNRIVVESLLTRIVSWTRRVSGLFLFIRRKYGGK